MATTTNPLNSKDATSELPNPKLVEQKQKLISETEYMKHDMEKMNHFRKSGLSAEKDLNYDESDKSKESYYTLEAAKQLLEKYGTPLDTSQSKAEKDIESQLQDKDLMTKVKILSEKERENKKDLENPDPEIKRTANITKIVTSGLKEKYLNEAQKQTEKASQAQTQQPKASLFAGIKKLTNHISTSKTSTSVSANKPSSELGR